MFLGNKCDLEEERMVTKEKGQKLAASCRGKFYETSAKTGVNVKEAFYTLARDIMDKLDPPVRMGGWGEGWYYELGGSGKAPLPEAPDYGYLFLDRTEVNYHVKVWQGGRVLEHIKHMVYCSKLTRHFSPDRAFLSCTKPNISCQFWTVYYMLYTLTDLPPLSYISSFVYE